MTTVKQKNKKKWSNRFWWVCLGVFIFCIALRFAIIINYDKAIKLSEYEEQIVEITDKQAIEESATKITYTIEYNNGNENVSIVLGKQDYESLNIGDAIYILVHQDAIQLGTKAQPYKVIKAQE